MRIVTKLAIWMALAVAMSAAESKVLRGHRFLKKGGEDGDDEPVEKSDVGGPCTNTNECKGSSRLVCDVGQCRVGEGKKGCESDDDCETGTVCCWPSGKFHICLQSDQCIEEDKDVDGGKKCSDKGKPCGPGAEFEECCGSRVCDQDFFGRGVICLIDSGKHGCENDPDGTNFCRSGECLEPDGGEGAKTCE